MKFSFLKYWLLTLILFSVKTNLFASHIVGGELTYAYLGNNQYKFTLHLYRDCTASTTFQSPWTIYFYKTTGYTDANLGTAASPVSLSLTNTYGGTSGTQVAAYYYSPCLTYPSGLCVAEAIFTGTVALPPIAGGYTVIYQNAARNSGILNFATNTGGGGGGGGAGSTYKCILPGIGNSADSSPVFTQLPPTAICQNQPFSFPCGATDGDGDSLSYSLYTPFNGTNAGPAGYAPLTWNSPYSLTNYIGGTPALAVDAKTGILTCNPPTVGRFVVGIRVDEYRNGNYIGSVYRDFQFNVTACNTVVTATVPTNHSSGGVNYILNCSSSTKVSFSNTSTPQNTLSTYYWNFGDTSRYDTSHLKAPTWVYHDTGTYTATLVMNPAAYGSNCSDTAHVTVKVYHRNNASYYYYSQAMTTCVPIYFRDSTTGAPLPLTYKWSFGDGSTSTLKDPVHVYLNGGTYTVTEIIQNAGQCMDTVKKILVISSAYPAAAILNNALNCTSLSNTFQNAASAANYNWFFGDPTTFADTSHLQNPTWVYPDSGVYTVEVITNLGFGGHCQDTAIKTFQIYPPFKVKYGYSPQMICINMPVQFTDSSSGLLMPNSWNWNFGDGTTSNLQNPSHTFITPGTYQIKLVAQNSKGCKDSFIITKTIYPQAIANISVPQYLNCFSNKVLFSTTGIAQLYSWDFGVTNITTDTSWHQNPIYNYSDSGVYNITLILNPGATGTCTDTATIAALKIYSPYYVGYEYSPPYICRRNFVQFTDTSKGKVMPNQWTWKLNDSVFSIAKNPIHQFNDTGIFNIKLIIWNSVGCHDSVTTPIHVYAPPKALIAAPSLVCSGLTVGFQSQTYSGGYFWKFNDNHHAPFDTSWHFSPTYTYADTGTYTAMFVVNPGAQDSCSDTAYATVRVFGPIVPKFGWFHAYNCPNHIIHFTDSSTSPKGPNQWLWNFGDGTTSALKNPKHIYSSAGSYLVKLIIYDAKGCMDSIVHSIVIDTQTHSKIIVPNLSCDSVIHFKTPANSTYWWNFGENASSKNTDTIQNPKHIYKLAGTYTTTLIVFPNTGCADTSHQTIQVEFGIRADFIPINVCVYDSAEFFNTANGGPSALVPTVWYFGDGDSMHSSSGIIRHIYVTANTYQVTQIAQNTFGCRDTIVHNVTIYPIPIIHAGRDTSICNLDTISLQSFGGSNYAWTPNYAIDDTTLQFPTVTPDKTTKYFVSVITSDGCVARDSVLITNVNPKSDGIIKDTIICFGDTIQLKAPTALGNLYIWSPALGLSNPSISNPLANIFQETIYQIYIRNGNCVRFDTAIVNVKVLATPNAGDDITICNNLSTTLHATHGTYFSWSPTTNMLYSNTPDPVVYPKLTTKYFVTVVDTTVCLKPETDSVTVYVDHYKNGYVQNDTNIVKNIPSTLNAYNGNYYLWMPSTGLSDSTSATPTCILQHDQVYVVKISDGNGCFNYDTVKVYVFPNPIVLMPNAFSPNGDGLDDVIMPIFAGIKTLNHFNIYNRWGQCVFSTTEVNQGWDGTFHGVQQPMDTYIYMIDGMDVEDNGFNYKGDITLIR